MAKQKKDIIIANPMYDVVFKHLMMADKDTARYFVGTILSEEIIDINLDTQEYTYKKEVKTPKNKSKKIKLIRLDFVATIRTKSGDEKKVLIELQQSFKPIDVFRFRTYLAKLYAAEENIIKQEYFVQEGDMFSIAEKVIDVRFIISIYILGFVMDDLPHIVTRYNVTGTDVIDGGEVLSSQHLLLKGLTHEAYFVQIPRIEPERYSDWSKCSELLKLFSLFEQRNFVEKDRKFLKKFIYTLTENDKILKKMVKILERIGADPYTMRVMEEQEFAAMNEEIWRYALAQRDSALAALQNQLEEYQRKYGKLNGAPD